MATLPPVNRGLPSPIGTKLTGSASLSFHVVVFVFIKCARMLSSKKLNWKHLLAVRNLMKNGTLCTTPWSQINARILVCFMCDWKQVFLGLSMQSLMLSASFGAIAVCGADLFLRSFHVQE